MWLATEKPSRVGELDEEMVYESRPGDVISLGATSWRITEITHDRVLVIPAPDNRRGCRSGAATTSAARRAGPRDRRVHR
ncbi:putative ATP-dependent helicase domain protein [Mycobacterium xenopi 4042]|uniref:Putative ATP-dependent helicase domain protein n=1 Tax=Mycobacterium xenopi 4042 TaxID=1299334 RepID=X7YKC6_MYCXE|nr:putative ATP-dependent helicase domain protein [Mycobacterium xenopi 4042]